MYKENTPHIKLQLRRQRPFILSARVIVVTDATVTVFPDTLPAVASLDVV